MNFERRKRKSWSDSSGVSEVVGNLLILMITVVLFSTIIAYVNQIPVPQLQTKADFSASIAFDDSGTTANLTLTHAGGAAMRASATAVILRVGSTMTSYTLSEDPSFGPDWWTTGVEWTHPMTGISTTTIIVATVYDLEKDYSVWGSQVSGGTGGNAPIILQRYVDSNTSTPTGSNSSTNSPST
jgi:FlaG/FlaF family flagellin (archaellin)